MTSGGVFCDTRWRHYALALAKGWLDSGPASQPDCGMFSYTLLKEHFQAGLLADGVSGRNKHDGSPESTLDK